MIQDKPVLNNLLIADYNKINLQNADFENLCLKIKGDLNIKKLAEELNNIYFNLKLRLDFNSKLSVEEFETFLKLLKTMG